MAEDYQMLDDNSEHSQESYGAANRLIVADNGDVFPGDAGNPCVGISVATMEGLGLSRGAAVTVKRGEMEIEAFVLETLGCDDNKVLMNDSLRKQLKVELGQEIFLHSSKEKRSQLERDLVFLITAKVTANTEKFLRKKLDEPAIILFFIGILVIVIWCVSFGKFHASLALGSCWSITILFIVGMWTIPNPVPWVKTLYLYVSNHFLVITEAFLQTLGMVHREEMTWIPYGLTYVCLQIVTFLVYSIDRHRSTQTT